MVPAILLCTLAALVLAPSSAHADAGAYFLLTAEDVDGPAWPRNFTSYSLFVASPAGLTKQHVAKIHTDVPHAKVLAYFDTQEMPLITGCSTGSPMGCNPKQRPIPDDPVYLGALRKAFPSTMMLRNLSTAPPSAICFFPCLASWIPYPASIAAVTRFHVEHTMPRGYDGVYLDDTVDISDAARWLREGRAQGLRVDADGDGKPDSPDQLDTQWRRYKPALVASLRTALGPHALLLGNSAGAPSVAGLNGITIEMESCARNVTACEAQLEGAARIAREGGLPPVALYWLTHSELVPPATQCKEGRAIRAKYAWVLEGNDWYDGSHVACR